ncbi:hypothetical protein MHAS44199_07455 [Mycolicibacterium hassiacum DSM 44199]|nr:hypothetical protein [Mycolicibacterium hassiacum DSM 44199]
MVSALILAEISPWYRYSDGRTGRRSSLIASRSESLYRPVSVTARRNRPNTSGVSTQMWSPAWATTSTASAAHGWSGLTTNSLPANVFGSSSAGSAPYNLVRTWCSANRPRMLVSFTNRSTGPQYSSGTSSRRPAPRSTFSTATRQRV